MVAGGTTKMRACMTTITCSHNRSPSTQAVMCSLMLRSIEYPIRGPYSLLPPILRVPWSGKVK